MTEPHHHYYDYGYSDWQCVEDDSATDYCETDSIKIATEAGCRLAGRWPAGLPGDHPAFTKKDHPTAEAETDD